MKFHVLAYEIEDDNMTRVVFKIFPSHKELTSKRHKLRHEGNHRMVTLPMIDIPASKTGLLFVNHMTMFAAAHTNLEWFVSNFKEEAEQVLGEGCCDES